MHTYAAQLLFVRIRLLVDLVSNLMHVSGMLVRRLIGLTASREQRFCLCVRPKPVMVILGCLRDFVCNVKKGAFTVDTLEGSQ